mmetsp:Transcript_18595/g.37628  ORF Transcript_18595/g.37628 Transcript_18595/m.37628 type:complete len:154 (+) Transcript_18595:1009-1470(+)
MLAYRSSVIRAGKPSEAFLDTVVLSCLFLSVYLPGSGLECVSPCLCFWLCSSFQGLSESPEVEAIRASLEARARSSEVQDGAARTAGSAGFGGGHAAASSSAGVRSSPSSAGGIPQRTRTTVEQGGGVISRPAVISRPPALRPGRSPPGPPPG